MIGLVALAMAGVPDEAALFGALLADLDADHDGRLSQAEYLRVDNVSEFPVIDADHDGYASAAELANWARVTQPRPRERMRPDTLGFAALGPASGGGAADGAGSAGKAADGAGSAGKAAAGGGGSNGATGGAGKAGAAKAAGSPARRWALPVAGALGLAGVGGLAAWWRRRRA